jgi:tRNA(fMet)-specific endonuclease VapC
VAGRPERRPKRVAKPREPRELRVAAAGLVLDSSVLIDIERERLSFGPLVEAYGNLETFVSVITVSELRHGVHRARDAAVRARRSAFVRQILDQVVVLPIDEAVADAHAQAWASLEEAGRMIGMNDLWIAATAIANGCALMTGNDNEFGRVAGLTVIPLRPTG